MPQLPQLRPLAYKADNRKKNNEKGGQPESCPRKPGGRLFRLLYAYETSYHYLCDFLDVSGIRNDYLTLFVLSGLFYEISERVIHCSDLLCDKLREGFYCSIVGAVVHRFCQQGSLIKILGGFRAVGYRAGDSPERVFHCGFVLFYRGIQRHEPDKVTVIVLLRLEDRLL